MLKQFWPIIINVRQQKPLIHSITNYVTVNDCANILLSFGASPAMCENIDEVEDFAAISNGLHINTGTLAGEQKKAIPLAMAKASTLNIPIVIDPVGVGAIPSRLKFTLELLKNNNISIIKGNLGEIKVLAGMDAVVRGVDSVDDGSGAIKACQTLAKQFNTTVMATGPQDIITDGTRTALIDNGSSMFTLITGSGCMLGALATATAAVEKDSFKACLTAALAMGITGELAAGEPEVGHFPGSFRVKLFDHIYRLTAEDFLEKGKLTWL